MIRSHHPRWFLGIPLLWLLPLSSTSSSSNKRNEDLCGMYLAPSTIQGAGMGVFAGHRNVRRGQYLLEDDGDLVVPVYDMTRHVGHAKYHFLWEEYTWRAAGFGGMSEEVDDVKKVKACSPGMGAAINCMLPLVNVVDDFDNRKVGLSGIEAVPGNNATAWSLSSPGAGAFSPYYNRRWKAKRYIPAGMELYGNYGEGYFKSRSSIYGMIPFRENYKHADRLLRTFQRITRKVATEEVKKDLLISLQSMAAIWDESRNMNAIPQTDPKGDHAVVDWLLKKTGGTGMLHYNSSIRDLDWLDEHGRCMDNIRDGVSTIPHAGRGAFARRKIRKGAIVAPAPLIQISDRDIFTIYGKKPEAEDKKGKETYWLATDHDNPIHHQLLLNYCFGHGESTLLLCPYGLMTSHINHDAVAPNTRVAWAADDQMAHPEWREKPIKKWARQDKAGLSFDFVALRDIEPGEEITIDYGDEWEEAWQRHLRSYYREEETNGSESENVLRHHLPAFELNKLVDLKLQTLEEGDYELQGLHLFCRKPYVEWYGASATVPGEDDDTLQVRTESGGTTTIQWNEHYDWDDEVVFPCRIRQRHTSSNNNNSSSSSSSNNNVSYSYFVEVFERYNQTTTGASSSTGEATTQDLVWAVLFGVPRDAFYFEDQKYRRHHHQTWSFRHEMMVPGDVFPEAWKNKKKKSTKR
ncbi:unnamed protein product [Pseudo-nitzschia multistriata]|uniref:SET domain-containing protein n=1 Tax=Pseudo-nitzschia multistriata TaxID=183589 RepID=A0A448ZLA8_9STRA|nr:unnamed protein product [Pseudo-nitzschia multistriata]